MKPGEIAGAVLLLGAGFLIGAFVYYPAPRRDCIFVKGAPGVNGAGAGGDATICGAAGIAIGGAAGDSRSCVTVNGLRGYIVRSGDASLCVPEQPCIKAGNCGGGGGGPAGPLQ